MARTPLKLGIAANPNSNPARYWSCWGLDIGWTEIRKEFSSVEYEHLVQQFRLLATEVSPSISKCLSIDKVEDFFELRDKGGVLGNTNARIFYGIDSDRGAVITLGGIKKQNNGPTPLGDKVRMRRRWRKYLNGDYGFPS